MPWLPWGGTAVFAREREDGRKKGEVGGGEKDLAASPSRRDSVIPLVGLLFLFGDFLVLLTRCRMYRQDNGRG